MKAILLFLLLLTGTVRAALLTTSGNEGFVSIASFPDIQGITNKITACLWVSRVSTSAGDGAGVFISKGGDVPPFEQWSIGMNLTNRLYFYFYRMGSALTTESASSTAPYTATNVIQFVAMSYDYANTNSLTWYLDSQQISNNTFFVNPVSAGPTNNTKDAEIGTGRDSSTPCTGGRAVKGYYSEVAIWNEILSQREIELIRTSRVKGTPMQVRPSNLQLYMPLDSVPSNFPTIPVGDAGDSRFPNRKIYGPFGRRCTGGTHPLGAGERICSYQPNE